MLTAHQEQAVRDAFTNHFGSPPDVAAFAPGRVNLLGEHTDYNGGYVLPMALLDLGVAIAVASGSAPGKIEIRSATLETEDTRHIDDKPVGTWSDYVVGCLKSAAASQVAEKGLRATLMTSLPIGAGLSSSAALEVATLRAVCQLYGVSTTPVQIAQTAQLVENEYVGMPCGIMDQFASSVGMPGTALFLDTRSLNYSTAPALSGHSFLILDSGVSHQLTDGGYASRVKECQAAREILGVLFLSDLNEDDRDRIDAMPEPLNRRARHILVENSLTLNGLSALKSGDAWAFGRLMNKSHATARENYEITIPETDALVAAAVAAGALGARQTGGGWGGAIVALVSNETVKAVSNELTARFSNARVLAIT